MLGNFPNDDIDWIGSQYFLTTDGYYTNANLNLSIRASEEIPGFSYQAARDTEYRPGFIPVWGRPQCGEWWSDPSSGIRARIMNLVDNELWTQAIIDTGTFDATKAKDDLVRALINPEAANFGRNVAIGSYGSPYGTPNNAFTNLFGAGAATYGAAREAIDWIPKIYALRQAAPIGQAFILLGINVFLPFVLLFSGYSGETLISVSVGVFGLKFLSAIWSLAIWLDNHLMTGLGISWSKTLTSMDVDRMASVTVLNLMAVLLFGILPMVWFAVIGWAGIHVHQSMKTLGDFNSQISNSATRITSVGGSAARNAYKRYASYKKSRE